jgi:hypothetical protein
MIEKAVTTFTYVTITSETKEKFTQINCDKNHINRYDYKFNVVKFNYSI